MTIITDETLVRVCRQIGKEGKPEFYLSTKLKFLSTILSLRHRDAAARVKSELENGYVVSLLYMNDGAEWGTSKTIYAVGIEADLKG